MSRPRLKILLCAPRGFCAGVDRAIQIVDLALARFGAPVYVRHEIVHNKYVVDELRAKGAVFVEELDEIPPTDQPVVFSAHGVARSVPEAAAARNLFQLDATCPLVTKVHREAEIHHRKGRHVILIGHEGHPEVIGTMGQLPEGAVTLIETIDDVGRLDFPAGTALSYTTQTTLSVDDTRAIVEAAHTLQYRSVNIDLIYGLPLQNPESFARTVAEVIALQPDRLSVFNYAHLPERFMPQRRINESDLPSPAQKLEMLQRSIEQLTAAGYRYIGMDHFALPDDELAMAQEDGTLQRNFQGYTTHGHCDLIGLGVSAISQVGDLYSQNSSDLANYQQSLANGQLATQRGLHCNADDRIRRAVIQALICQFQLDFGDIEQRFAIDFRSYFSAIWPQLQQLDRDGLIELGERGIEVRPAGRLLVRSVCMLFDHYLEQQNQQRFSRVI